MADAKGKKEDDKPAASTPDTAKAAERTRMGIRLAPVDNSDQPVLANYTNLNIAPGMVFIDFGFIEPGLLTAIPRVARSGGKLPESVNGKLAVRVAMGYDGLANLHQQLGRMLGGLREASARAAKKAS
jgi:hypothetical protein